MLTGDFGESVRFKAPVADILWPRLWNTAILAFWTFAILVPLSLTLGVLAGMREGSALDRAISITSIITTSVPEFASAVFLSAIFVFALGILPGTSGMTDGFDPLQLVLPVMVLILYDVGYVTRMTRASMAEVMTTPYIRTAVLKGLPFGRVVFRHALRNALIAPFHGDHVAGELAVVRCDRRRVLLRLQRLWRPIAGSLAQPGHLPD